MRRISALAVLLAAASLPMLAENFSGKWALPGAAGSAGRGGPTVLTLNHAGNEVTGTVKLPVDNGTTSPVNEEIWDGKVEGNTISFYVWTGADQPVKTSYRGTISASGDEISFTVTRGQAGGGQPSAAGRGGDAQQTTARRVK